MSGGKYSKMSATLKVDEMWKLDGSKVAYHISQSAIDNFGLSISLRDDGARDSVEMDDFVEEQTGDKASIGCLLASHKELVMEYRSQSYGNDPWQFGKYHNVTSSMKFSNQLFTDRSARNTQLGSLEKEALMNVVILGTVEILLRVNKLESLMVTVKNEFFVNEIMLPMLFSLKNSIGRPAWEITALMPIMEASKLSFLQIIGDATNVTAEISNKPLVKSGESMKTPDLVDGSRGWPIADGLYFGIISGDTLDNTTYVNLGAEHNPSSGVLAA
ncbi:hypothetical protein TorRG33x02_355690 [Trema orientale]|uniref:Uncharacterized protein n=1 Tax=Trema orientale TaxID=63057 RepID=A0A2P5A8W9_TREOI|nr:hypothetical protein TorRG33x02_355690 [Trema orientale]